MVGGRQAEKGTRKADPIEAGFHVAVNVSVILPRRHIIGNTFPPNNPCNFAHSANGKAVGYRPLANSIDTVLNGPLVSLRIFEGNLLRQENSQSVGRMTVVATADMIRYYGINGVIPPGRVDLLISCCMTPHMTLEVKMHMLKLRDENEKEDGPRKVWAVVGTTIALDAGADEKLRESIRAAIVGNDFHARKPLILAKQNACLGAGLDKEAHPFLLEGSLNSDT